MTGVYSKTPDWATSKDTKDRVNWWKKWNELDAEIRHDMFGATLTGYESKNWDSQTVNENADPAIIRQRMADRLSWATGAYKREIEGYEQAGYSTGKKGGAEKAPTPSSPKGVRRYNPATGRIE
jgi:hypothetical protein